MSQEDSQGKPTPEVDADGNVSNPSDATQAGEGQPSYEELQKRLDDVVKGTNKVMEENARIKKAFAADDVQANSLTEDELAAQEMLTQRLGYANKDYVNEAIENRIKAAEDKSELDRLMVEFPNLAPHRNYIEKIGMVENEKSWEEIIGDTKLVEMDKLQQASKRPIMGIPISKEAPSAKNPTAMSDDEYDAWLDANTANKKYK